MGNIKKYGGNLPDSWHKDQVGLLRQQLNRYEELGIKYVLPAFAGFVPDQITRFASFIRYNILNSPNIGR